MYRGRFLFSLVDQRSSLGLDVVLSREFSFCFAGGFGLSILVLAWLLILVGFCGAQRSVILVVRRPLSGHTGAAPPSFRFSSPRSFVVTNTELPKPHGAARSFRACAVPSGAPPLSTGPGAFREGRRRLDPLGGSGLEGFRQKERRRPRSSGSACFLASQVTAAGRRRRNPLVLSRALRLGTELPTPIRSRPD